MVLFLHGQPSSPQPLSRLAGNSALQTWNTSSGLPQNTVRQFLETRDGFLWMATDGGLVRFDGSDFTVFDRRNTPQFQSDLINALFEDHAGRLWIATSNGLIERSSQGLQRFTSAQGLPSTNVLAVNEDARGKLWIATSQGLASLSADRFTRATPPLSILSTTPETIFASANHTLWVPTRAAVYRISPAGQLARFPAPPNSRVSAAVTAPDNTFYLASGNTLLHFTGAAAPDTLPTPLTGAATITNLAYDAAGTLWMGTSNGLFRREGTGWVHLRDSERQGKISHISIEAQHPEAGTLWCVTTAGLFRLVHDRLIPAPQENGFAGDSVLTLYEDREGDLWLGSDNAGATILRHLPFQTLGTEEGLPTETVRTLLAAPTDGLWFGTSDGLTLSEAGTTSTLHVSNGLASDEILSLAPAADHQHLWIGTPDGLSYLDPRTRHATTLTAADGLPDDTIRSLMLAEDGTLWIGTSHGLAHLPGPDPASVRNLLTYTHVSGLASNIVGALAEGSDHSIWIGTLSGLSHFKDGHFRTFAARDGITTPLVTALAMDGDTLWIGTSGGGLYSFADGHILHAGEGSGNKAPRMPATIYGILRDPHHFLWLSTASGIDRIAESDAHALLAHPEQPVAIEHYTVADGLRLNDCASGGHPEALLTQNGDLWFATSRGAAVVASGSPLLDRPAPAVQLENISLDDQAVSWKPGEAMRIPAGRPRIALHYAGLSLASPTKVQYRYRLQPFDPAWIDAGARRTAYYTNLAPGRYSFSVLASLDGGQWSAAAATINFTIAPHYYQTWWFYTALAALLTLIGWQLYLYRLRQVELRYDAVLAERGRIAREIHDTLAQDIVAISVQLELVSRLLTSSVDKARTQLEQTRSLVRSSLDDARSSIWDLRSSSSAGDLPTRLRALVRRLTASSSIELRFQITGSYRTFPQKVEEEFLRISQESINNALRHASCSTILVTLVYDAKGVTLTVQDDGKGFATDQYGSGLDGHFGIRGMRERAERAGATLQIESTPGAGTRVCVQAPG